MKTHYIFHESWYKEQKDPKEKKNTKRSCIIFLLPWDIYLWLKRPQKLWDGTMIELCMVDGQLSHPTDRDERIYFDCTFLNFSKKFQNVRLGFSSDGFDLFHDAHVGEYTGSSQPSPLCNLYARKLCIYLCLFLYIPESMKLIKKLAYLSYIINRWIKILVVSWGENI